MNQKCCLPLFNGLFKVVSVEIDHPKVVMTVNILGIQIQSAPPLYNCLIEQGEAFVGISKVEVDFCSLWIPFQSSLKELDGIAE